jgi:hypothetical protein
MMPPRAKHGQNVNYREDDRRQLLAVAALVFTCLSFPHRQNAIGEIEEEG